MCCLAQGAFSQKSLLVVSGTLTLSSPPASHWLAWLSVQNAFSPWLGGGFLNKSLNLPRGPDMHSEKGVTNTPRVVPPYKAVIHAQTI